MAPPALGSAGEAANSIISAGRHPHQGRFPKTDLHRPVCSHSIWLLTLDLEAASALGYPAGVGIAAIFSNMIERRDFRPIGLAERRLPRRHHRLFPPLGS